MEDDVEARKLRKMSVYVSTLKDAKKLIDIFKTAEAASAHLKAEHDALIEQAMQEALEM